MQGEVQKAREEGKKVIYIDEVVFSPATALKFAWSGKGTNIEVADKRQYVKTQALIAGISEEGGVEGFMVKKKSIKTAEYIEFLNLIKTANKDSQVVIFADNLSVHKTKKSREALTELGFECIYNVPYSPEFNGIELLWAAVKRQYKKKVHQKMTSNGYIDVEAQIVESMKEVDPDLAKRCAASGRRRILNA